MDKIVYKFPFLLSLIAVIGGVFISIIFGANEDFFKNKIKSGLEKNIEIQSISDPIVKADKLKSEADKNWRYYQRYHFHANGIASLSLAILVLLTLIQISKIEFLISSYLVTIGGFLYPFVWLFAGIYGPSIGRENAKEAFALLGYMGGVYLLGVIYTFILIAVKPWNDKINKFFS